MFRNKILNSLSKNSRNSLKIKSTASVHNGSTVSPQVFVCQSVINSKRQDFNGFPKTFMLIRHNEFEKSKRNSSQMSSENCWKCKEELGNEKFICSACGSIQKPSKNTSYFELLGIKETFDVNLEDLSIKFRNLQMAFHPDKFVNKSQVEQETSEKYSRLLNKAYSTLKDPVARGFYLLQKQKFEVDPNHPLDQSFLISVMEKNEELESLKTDTDLKNFLKSNGKEMEKYIENVSNAFKQNNLPEAKIQIMKLNYYVNMDNKVKQKIIDLSLSKNV